MKHYEIILSGLALSFCWVNLIRPHIKKTEYEQNARDWLYEIVNSKPLNCVMCCSGWASMGISLCNGHTITAILFLAVGTFIGAVWECILMRWL